jgi:hypothetical protein
MEAEKFCTCIKKVRKTRKNEGAAIAICTSSILHKRGRTLKKFKCKKHPHLQTQAMKGGQQNISVPSETRPRSESEASAASASSGLSGLSGLSELSGTSGVSSASRLSAEQRENVTTSRPQELPVASGPVGPVSPTASAPTDEDRRRAAYRVIDIVESTPLPSQPVVNENYTERDVKDTENFVICNTSSKFVIVTYWWGRGNDNRNLQHPCPAYEKASIDEIRKYVENYDYIKDITDPVEREQEIQEAVNAEYAEVVKAEIEEMSKSLGVSIEEARRMRNTTTPTLKFEKMIERFKKDCVRAKCNFLVQEYTFERALYQAAINGKPVFIRKAIEACKGKGPNNTNLSVVYIDGDMRPNVYPKIFDMENVDFMARGWNVDPRSNRKYRRREPDICFDPYIFETSGGIQYFANTAGSLDLLETWKWSNLANPGKADDRVISIAFNVLKYHQCLSFVQLPIEYLWLTDNYYFQDPANTNKTKAIIEHPECLTAEDAAVGASASREPNHYQDLVENVKECKRVGGRFYEFVFFDSEDQVETMKPYLDYLKSAKVTLRPIVDARIQIKLGTIPLFEVISYAEKYGEHNATAEANQSAADSLGDDVPSPTTFDIPAILKQLQQGRDVTLGNDTRVEQLKSTGAIDFVAYVKNTPNPIQLENDEGEMENQTILPFDSTYPDARPVFDTTKPMFFSAKNRVLREVLKMCQSAETMSEVFNESYTFLSRIRCYWLR